MRCEPSLVATLSGVYMYSKFYALLWVTILKLYYPAIQYAITCSQMPYIINYQAPKLYHNITAVTGFQSDHGTQTGYLLSAMVERWLLLTATESNSRQIRDSVLEPHLAASAASVVSTPTSDCNDDNLYQSCSSTRYLSMCIKSKITMM